MKRLNPFKGLPNAKAVWAWGMYDLANQSFTLLITTLFFAIYFKEHVVGDEQRGALLWGAAFSTAAVIVVVISPLLGAIADYTSLKKEFLSVTGIACAVLTMSLALLGPGDVALAFALYVCANVCFMSGENFLAAFLPEVSTKETVGRVSAIGWTMGYVGALVCLPLALVIPGVGKQEPMAFRLVFVFAGVWFLINIIPTLMILKERKRLRELPKGRSVVAIGFGRVFATLRNVSKHRDLAVFLLCFLVYSCGVQAIIVFSGLLASQYLKSGALLVGFVWALALVSGMSSFVIVFVQDRIGHRFTVTLSLVVWIVTCVSAALLPKENAQMVHLALTGIGVGVGLGLVGPASRAVVGMFTPRAKTAEFFALWGLSYKLAGAIGPATFGAIKATSGSQSVALGVLALFFGVGLVGLSFVNMKRGQAAAEATDLEMQAEEKLADEAARAAAGVVGGTAIAAAAPGKEGFSSEKYGENPGRGD